MRRFLCLLALAQTTVLALPASAELDWGTALNGEHRSTGNTARDVYRHPRETLEFFGISEDMTVVELAPGGGWYTEILAPLLHERGEYYAAHYGMNGRSYYRRALGAYLQKLGENDDVYGNVTVTTLMPTESVLIAPGGTADMVLAFRNVHSWMRGEMLPETFATAYAALKPGGVFGVVQHRARDNRSVEQMKESGYVTEALVIETAEAAGFQLAARSEINANPGDSADYAGGVWELPPGLRGDESTRAQRLAIGESDRMTLKFVKPQ